MMTFSKKIGLLFFFYRSFVFLSIGISLIGAFIFYKAGYPLLPMLVWLKVIVSALIFFYINSYKKQEYFYYTNLGLSKYFLWRTTMIFDLSFFLLLLVTVEQ